MTGWREAREELMLHTLVTSRAGRKVRVRRRKSLREDAEPTATSHLRTVNVSVDTLTCVTLLLPVAAVRKLQVSVTTWLTKSDELLAARSSTARRTETTVAIDLVHAG